MEKIRVVSACDSNYAKPLGIMMVSLLENTYCKEKIEFYVIDGGISAKDEEDLRTCVSKYGCKVNFLVLKPERYQDLKKQSYFSYATYFRIFVPELMDQSIKKVIYLDCDLIVRGDIVKLWKTDVSNYFIAAVEDVGMENSGDYGAMIKRNIGMPRKFTYFNAGVLIINLDKWRRNNISNKIRDYLISNKDKITFADQDGLNKVFMEQWLHLPMEWNQQAVIYDLYKERKINRTDMMNAILNPKIIHYSQKSKPWHYTDIHPLKDEYNNYVELSPWKDLKPHGSFKDKLVKAFNKTWAGEVFRHYRKKINDYYMVDKTFISDKLTSFYLFKLLYSIFFPLVYTYLRFFSRIVLLSYDLENKKLIMQNNNFLLKMLYFCVVPVRYLIPKRLRDYCRKDSYETKYTCPCCGYKTFTKDSINRHAPCRICCWEYDLMQHYDPDYAGGANAVSLRIAQQNYLKYGASEERYRHGYYYNQVPCFYFKKDSTWRVNFNLVAKTRKIHLIKGYFRGRRKNEVDKKIYY
ncbi:MAG TPA: glycosyltransferase [Clostridia bacterium]